MPSTCPPFWTSGSSGPAPWTGRGTEREIGSLLGSPAADGPSSRPSSIGAEGYLAIFQPVSMDFTLSRILQSLVLILGLAAAVCSAPVAAAELLVKEIRYPDGGLKERYSFTLDVQGREVREGLNEEWYPG